MKNLKDRACKYFDMLHHRFFRFLSYAKTAKIIKTAGLSTVCSNTGIYLPGTLFQKSVQAVGRKQKRRCLSGNPGVFSGSRRSLRLRRVFQLALQPLGCIEPTPSTVPRTVMLRSSWRMLV